MDLLRNCTSGVHVIEGLECIPYRVFAPEKKVEPNKRTYAARLRVLDAEHNARKGGSLAVSDLKKLQLWVFETTETPNPSSSPVAHNTTARFTPPSDSGLQCIHSGELLPSELHKEHALVKPDKTESFPLEEVYSCFISSCLRSLSFHIAKEAKAIPLSTHSFVVCEARNAKLGASAALDSACQQPCQIFSLKVELVRYGYLQVAIESSEQPHFHSVAKHSGKRQIVEESDYSWMVFMAPSSRLARTHWREELLSSSNTSGPVESKPQQPAEWIFTEQQRQIWRKTVIDWLQWQGLDFHDLRHDDEWTKVTAFLKFPHSEDATPRSNLRADRLTLEWPANLCFQQIRSSMQDSEEASPECFDSESNDGTQWFRNLNQEGFRDPLKLAISWMENKTQLENELETRKARMEAEISNTAAEDAATDIFDAQSPLDIRTMSYQDAQIVYPTPSDGLPAHVTPGSMSFENGHLQSSQSADVGSPTDMEPRVTDNKDRRSNYNPRQSYGGDDSYFGSTALTDADFDFFDQPDLLASTDNPDQMEVDGLEKEDRNDDQLSESVNRTVENSGGSENAAKPSPGPRAAEKTVHAVDAKSVTPTGGQRSSPDQETILNGYPENSYTQISTFSAAPETNREESKVSDAQVRHTIDDKKYLDQGRFSFKPRKRPRDSSIPHSSTTVRESFSVVLSSPTPAAEHKNKPLPRLARFQPSKTKQIEDSSTNSDSESSQSDIDSLRKRALTTRQSNSNDSGMESTESGTLPNPSSAPAKLSGNQKYWNIDEFDALAGTMLMSYFKPSPMNWSLAHFLTTDPISPYHSVNLAQIDTKDTIVIAQLLADQFALKFDGLHLFEPAVKKGKFDGTEKKIYASSDLGIDRAISKTFPTCASRTQDLYDFMSYRDSEEGEDQALELFRIAPAQVRLQRSQVRWDFTSSAPAFWETLGLEPAHGSKQVAAFCVYPWSETIGPSIDNFLRTMESTWLNQKLGNHAAGDLNDGSEQGHAPVKLESVDQEAASAREAVIAFSNVCRDLGSHLRDKYASDETIIIYVVNPFKDASALVSLCSAFWALIQAYTGNENAQAKVDGRNIALQIVPIDLIASIDSIAVIDQETANSLAHNGYGRCWPTEIDLDAVDLPIPSGESILLAKPVPQTIPFQLSLEPSSNVLDEDSCLHLAYCESLDRRWLAVAWTDATGEYQHNACYHLGGLQTGGSVIQEIWETTLDVIKRRRVHWRLIVAKCGPLNQHEQKIWHGLASLHGAGNSYSLSLVSVDASPTLTVSVKPSVKMALMEATGHAANTYSTPVSTPHPQQLGSSPAPSSPSNIMAAASTPSAEQAAMADADLQAHFFDRTDESWGILLRRRRNVVESAVDYNPALASGYLMKRTGVGDLDPPALIEVNLMHTREFGSRTSAVVATAAVGTATTTSAEPRDAEDKADGAKDKVHAELLREILVMYRNLGLLARLRKMEGRDSCTPWHVAVAARAAEGLGRCMRM